MKKYALALLAVVLVVMVGCRKEPVNNLTDEESRIYITNYDKTVDFNNYQTFSIADSVTVIDGNQYGVQYNSVDQAFVTAIKQKMQSLGYSLVNRSANPDLGINVSRIINTTTGIINYNDYYNYYGSYYDPYYWGYPGYGYGAPGWGYATTYQIKEGLLNIDIVDLKDAASNNTINAVWNGMIRGSGIFNASTASSQIDQLFEQSPYLSKN